MLISKFKVFIKQIQDAWTMEKSQNKKIMYFL